MAHIQDKPDPFQEGKYRLSAGDLNMVTQAVLRQIRSGGRLSTSYFGDRILQEDNNSGQPQLPGPTNYLKQFVVLEELRDVLLCAPFQFPITGLDIVLTPQPYDPDLLADSDALFYVAKPYMLQETPWQGKTAIFNGVIQTFDYSPTEIGVRDASGVTQSITPSYTTGDIILAARCQTGYEDYTGGPCVWMDENAAGRTWLSPGGGSITVPITTPTDVVTYCVMIVHTTNTATLSSTGSQVMTPASMDGIFVGAALFIDTPESGDEEVVTVTAVTSTTFTAVFANIHANACPIQAARTNFGGVLSTPGYYSGSWYKFNGGLNTLTRQGNCWIVDDNNFVIPHLYYPGFAAQTQLSGHLVFYVEAPHITVLWDNNFIGTAPAINFLTGPGIDLLVEDDPALNCIDVGIANILGVRKNGTLVGERPAINFIQGTNVTLTVADNAGSNRVDVTIAASGGTTAASLTVEGNSFSAGGFVGYVTLHNITTIIFPFNQFRLYGIDGTPVVEVYVAESFTIPMGNPVIPSTGYTYYQQFTFYDAVHVIGGPGGPGDLFSPAAGYVWNGSHPDGYFNVVQIALSATNGIHLIEQYALSVVDDEDVTTYASVAYAVRNTSGSITTGGTGVDYNGNQFVGGLWIQQYTGFGVSGSFTTVDSKTVTVTHGIITSIV